MIRRYFIAAASMLILTIGVASPVKSLLGANGAEYVGESKAEYTAKDYIQDGLIAMWDGIENAGFGVHDPNAIIWKDLIGTRDMTFINSYSFEVNCLYLDSYIANGSFRTFEKSKNYTIEIIHQRLLQNKYGAAIISLDDQWYNTICYLPSQGFRFSEANAPYIAYPTADKNIHALSMSWSGKQYLNGVRQEDLRTPSRYSCGTVGHINDNQAWDRGGDKSRWYCIRIYSRPLTDDEVIHNYTIDKNRFRL